MAIVHVHIPEELLKAMESGEISSAQLRELIRIEAEAIGLSFAGAVSAAHHRTLPSDPIGTDLGFLVSMLEHEPIAAD